MGNVEFANPENSKEIKKIMRQIITDEYRLNLMCTAFGDDRLKWIKYNEEGNILGSLLLRNSEFPIFSIDFLAVKKENQRKGIGRELVDFAVNQAIEGGGLLLEVGSSDYFNAKDFYIKTGFDYQGVRPEVTNGYYHFFTKRL